MLAQSLIEGVEAVHLQLALGLAMPAHIQAYLMDSFRVGERAWEVVGAVGCDRDGSHAARDATPTPARAPLTRTSRSRCRSPRAARRPRTAGGLSASRRWRRAPGECAGRVGRRRRRTVYR